jgi:hypothetical protein
MEETPVARPITFASALAALLMVACTRAASSAATPGDTTPAAHPTTPSPSPSTTPGAPVPDQRTPQPAPDTAPPSAPPSAHPGKPDVEPPGATSRASDSAHVAALERAAVALAKTTGCSSDDQCRNAPVGIKACGGARYYLKYCAASTDSVALFRALARLDSAERAYNAKYHVISTCQMILPTRPHLVAGACH